MSPVFRGALFAALLCSASSATILDFVNMRSNGSNVTYASSPIPSTYGSNVSQAVFTDTATDTRFTYSEGLGWTGDVTASWTNVYFDPNLKRIDTSGAVSNGYVPNVWAELVLQAAAGKVVRLHGFSIGMKNGFEGDVEFFINGARHSQTVSFAEPAQFLPAAAIESNRIHLTWGYNTRQWGLDNISISQADAPAVIVNPPDEGGGTTPPPTDPAAVPEPGTIVLGGAGLALIVFARSRRRK